MRPPIHPAAFLTTGAGVLVLGVVAVVAVGCSGPTAVSTTVAPVPVAPVPASPTGVAWRWTAPTPLRALVPAGAGVVVAGDDGVTALDGVTGSGRWRFARPGRALTTLQVSPDGRSVLLVHDGGSLTVLDALTGALRWEDDVDGEPALVVTDSVVVLARASGSQARDLVTGSALWTGSTTPGCVRRPAPQWSVGAVPVAEWCAGRTVVRGRDDRTGAVRWTLDAGPAEPAGGAGLASSADGTLAVVTGPEPRLLVDLRTGVVRARVPRVAGSPLLGEGLPRVELLNRLVPAVAVLDPDDGSVRPAPPSPCDDASLLVLPSTTVQACSDDLGDSVTVGGGPPIDLGELAPGGGPPLGRPDRVPDDPELMAAPGAVVVANRSARSVVVGLR